MAAKFKKRLSQTIQEFNFQYPSMNEKFGLQLQMKGRIGSVQNGTK